MTATYELYQDRLEDLAACVSGCYTEASEAGARIAAVESIYAATGMDYDELFKEVNG